jgi:hypothetical protein
MPYDTGIEAMLDADIVAVAATSLRRGAHWHRTGQGDRIMARCGFGLGQETEG